LKHEYVDAKPNAGPLISSMRSMGYTLNSAIADIIDNSITAKSSEIHYEFSWDNGVPFISIIDDGYGMVKEELIKAMSFGCKDPDDKREPDDLGRFGMGLKTASFSLCTQLTVISKTVDTEYIAARWDLNEIGKHADMPWRLEVLELDQIVKSSVSKRLIEYHHENSSTGTIVILENLDRLNPDHSPVISEDTFNKMIYRSSSHLSLTFHRFLAGEKGIRKIRILANQRELKPFDPFNSSHIAVTEMPEHKIYINNDVITVQPYVLPHHSKVSRNEYDKLSGEVGYLNSQGFYVYRQHRLLISGTWFRLHRNEELSKLVRIRIDIPNSLDHIWNIDIRKSKAFPPESIRVQLKTVIETIVNRGKRVYLHKGRNLGPTTTSHIWNRTVVDGGIRYTLNRQHPSIKHLSEKLGKDFYQSILRLIESSFPVDLYYRDFANNPEKMDQESLSEDDFGSILRMFVNTVLFVDPNIDLDKVLKETEPFASNYEKSLALLE